MATRSNGFKTTKMVTNSRGTRSYTRSKIGEAWKITGWSGKAPIKRKVK